MIHRLRWKSRFRKHRNPKLNINKKVKQSAPQVQGREAFWGNADWGGQSGGMEVAHGGIRYRVVLQGVGTYTRDMQKKP